MSNDPSEIPIPDTLHHYYRKVSRPFQTLSELSADQAAAVIDRLSHQEPLPRRLVTPRYLSRRRQIEQTMRDQFVRKGGRPNRDTPHYMILGTWSHWEQDDGFASVTIPLSEFAPEIISFTYPDSWVSFTGEMLSGEPLPRFPYHGRVYRLDELESLVTQHGLPAERWRTDEQRRMETYIEVQIWDDAVISRTSRQNDSGVSRDGSPVAVYRTLPPAGEPELIHAASRPHSAILELGCGAGRITHELLRLGHEVVAVDNCQDMLQWVRGAETVLSDIETLQLQRQFDTVVLAGHFMNVPEERKRRELLSVCRQHLAPDGVVLVQRYDPGLLDARKPGESQIGDVRIRFEIVSADFSTGRFAAKAADTIGSQCWEQEFEAQVLTDEALNILVHTANLRLDRWLDDKRTWAVLKAVHGTESQTGPLV